MPPPDKFLRMKFYAIVGEKAAIISTISTVDS